LDGSPTPATGIIYDTNAGASLGGSGFGRPVILDDDSVAFIAQTNATGGAGNHALVKRNGRLGALSILERAPLTAIVDNTFDNYYFGLDSNLMGPLSSRSHISFPRDTNDVTVGWYAKLRLPNGTGDPRRGGVFCAVSAVPGAANTLLRQNDAVPGLGLVKVEGSLTDKNSFNGISMNSTKITAISCETDQPRPGGGSLNKHVVIVSAQNIPGMFRTVAFEGNPAPGTSANFSNLDFAAVINNDSNSAFRAQLDDGAWGIWAESITGPGFDDHTLELVALTGPSGISGPSGSVAWTGFSDPIIAADNSKYFTASFDYNGGSHTGVFGVTPDNTTSYIIASTAGGLGNTTPKQPNHQGPGGTVGQFTGFAEPFVNESGNISFLADINIFEFELLANLSDIPAPFIDRKGVFSVDHFGELRTVVTVGMTMADIDPFAVGPLVITDLRFESETNRINTPETLEGGGSGYQDGRRMPMTNAITDFGPGSDCKTVSFGFVAVVRDITNPSIPTESLIVAELIACDSGSGCTSCLCSLDPNCIYQGLLLSSGPDFDDNGVVDTVDLLIANDALGLTHGRADLTLDGIVDNNDLDYILNEWGQTAPE